MSNRMHTQRSDFYAVLSLRHSALLCLGTDFVVAKVDLTSS
jgi:hypothetical protein